MADLRPTRTFSIQKVKNLWRNAHTALKDARAPVEFVSVGRRFEAAYDCGLINEAAVASALEWAERITAETEGWLQQNQPLALK